MYPYAFHCAIFAATLAAAAPVTGAPSPPPAAQGSTAEANRSACRSSEGRASRRAIDAWCDSDTPIAQRYKHWSRARTKQRACLDLRAAFARCEDVLRNLSLEGDEGHFVVVDYPKADVTYWQVTLKADGRALRVTEVEYYEDCNGP